jgi:catechol 2,3-dioxygenase-like lactoylglutathione lyase family enzyme
VTKAHHTAICTRDVETSLRFWRDGLGFEVTMDEEFDGDWATLFEASTSRLRSVFLGDPSDPSAGTVELVDLGPLPDAPSAGSPTRGFFLVSVYLDVDVALARLADLGLGGAPRRIEVQGVAMAVVRDPNDVRVELIGIPS